MAHTEVSASRIGFVISPHTNGSYLLANQTGLARCPKCGELLSRTCSLKEFKMKKKLDLSSSEDGGIFSSEKFKRLWAEFGGKGLSFIRLPSQPGFFLLEFNDVLEFDSERRKCRSENYRPCCKRYFSFVGATPAYLRNPDLIRGNHAYRSDVEFGSGDEKSPLLIIGLEIGLKLKHAKLSGWCAADVLR